MGVIGNWDPSGFIAEYGLGQGVVSMLFMVIGAITTNAVLLYSSITSVLPLRAQKVELGKSRWIILAAIVALTFGLCYTPILDLFGTFLVAISGALISSFFGIVVADWIYNKYHVDNVEDLYDMNGPFRFMRGFNWRALVPMAVSIGIIEYIYFYHYASITPVGILLPGMAISGAVYLLINKIWPPKYERKEVTRGATTR
jgi:nucleobase:cation symporter-1, NCS1 family